MLLLLILISLTVLDLKTNRISNTIVLTMLLMFLGIASFQSGNHLIMALYGMSVGFGLFIIPYLLGYVGGADVKVFAAVGSCLGIGQVFNAFIYTLISGMLLLIIFKLCRYEKPIWASCREIQSNQTSVLYKSNSIPYLPAITMGTVLSILLPLEWNI